jgi:hypothetical protein
VNDGARCYGIRRLNPLRGVLQVLELPGVRALSDNGRHWEIQVLAARPEHDWRSPNRGEPIMQYFRFGIWTPDKGLGRVPVSPILDLDTMLAGAERITNALPGCLQRLPFPPGDPYELWLLDPQHRAVALAATATAPDALPGSRAEAWSACALSEHGFTAPSLSAAGIPTKDDHNPRRHAAELEQRVRKRLGHNPTQQWYLRQADADPLPMDPAQAPPQDGFPQLPLTTEWDDGADAALARDYLEWCAPALLTLPGLCHETRQRLEQAARSQALRVDALYRLYPQIIDQGLIDAARVEAKLRRSRA